MLTQHRLLMLSDEKPQMIVTVNPVMRRREMNRPTRQIVVHCLRLLVLYSTERLKQRRGPLNKLFRQ